MHSPRWLRRLLALALLGTPPLAHAAVDDSLVAAIESLWGGQQPVSTVLGSSFAEQPSKAGTEYRVEGKNAPIYRESGGESAAVVVGRRSFNAVATPWGNFPQLDMHSARLLDMNLAKKHYQVLVGSGTGLFAVGDWQRYGFLHVLDVSSPAAPVYYPLYADAHLGELVLGRLPDSAVLNYARLVPTSRGPDGEFDGYEVSLYALGRKGPERVLKEGKPLAYSLKHDSGGWSIESMTSTPVSAAQDEEHLPFTAPLRPALFKARENASQ